MRAGILAVILLISGCATEKPVQIMYNCPAIELPVDPEVPVKKLKKTSTPDQVVKAWVATAVAYREWNKNVRAEVNSLR